MIGVTYLGNNPETQERLKYIPGRLVQFATNYKEAANMCSPHVQNEHFILFFEQSVQAEDVTAITYLNKECLYYPVDPSVGPGRQEELSAMRYQRHLGRQCIHHGDQ